MNLKIRIASGMLAFLCCFSALPAAGYGKGAALRENQAQAEAKGEETEIIEVTDLASLQEAAVTVKGEDKAETTEEADSLWRSKRLLVKSKEAFDPAGAESMILGYEDMYILDYATEEAAKRAYAKLDAKPGLCVEADIPYNGTAEESSSAGGGEQLPAALEEQEAKTKDGRDVLVAVIDSGYDLKSYGSERLVDGTDLTDSGSIQDDNGHGTAMANIILEHAPGSVTVMPVKAADENGRTSSLKLYLGIRYAIEHQADIINISMSAYKASNAEVIHAVIGEARRAGIFVVASAGNAGKDVADFSPANAGEAIAVSAVNADFSFAEYSNYGEGVDYCSYGNAQVSGIYGKTVRQEGTSVAAAIVSAVLAKAKSYHDHCSYQELESFLKESARDLGEAGKDSLYGNGFLSLDTIESWEPDKKREKPEILTCDWENMPLEEWNAVIGSSTNMERRIFLEQLSKEEMERLRSMNTMFFENVIYSETSVDADGNEKETFRMQGTLYDIVMSDAVSDEYEVQEQKYHIFAYGSQTGTRSCIKLDTDANTNDATIYCWMQDRSTDDQNNGKCGLTFVAGDSAYDFSACTHKIENCDAADSGNPVVWRLKIRNVKAQKPAGMAVNYSSELWNTYDSQTTAAVGPGHWKPYWYIFHYQVKPASDADRQRAYESGKYHGGFWDLADASGKQCGSTLVTTAVDIGTVDLYTHDNKYGITYRLPLTRHSTLKTSRTVTTAATCAKAGSSHVETTYTCPSCNKTWKENSNNQSVPRLAHDYRAKYEANNGIANGKYWEECSRNCGVKDVNGGNWQRNIKYLQPISYYEMDVNGAYPQAPTGTDRNAAYYAAGEVAPAWSRTPSDEFLPGTLAAFSAPAYAFRHTVLIPRKRYTVKYDGNKATSGMMEPQTVFCGETFQLRDNCFSRIGYVFKGWSVSVGAPVIKETAVKNLSLSHNDTVTLYANWEPVVYRINLDNQYANLDTGTAKVYEHYAVGYYEDSDLKRKFVDDKIEIPQKERADASLFGGVRRQRFMGYYTDMNGDGYQVIEKDGSLIANVKKRGDYQYFEENSRVYAKWTDMSAIQFSPNLSEAELALLKEGEEGEACDEPVICPSVRWKEKKKSITVGFGEAIVKNQKFSDLFRLKGWSLTPQIHSDDEIILSRDKAAYTFTADEDVTLYAQWDTSLMVAYAGNGQTEGDNYLEKIEKITDLYEFSPNIFVKAIQKPAKDIATGQMADEAGSPYLETVPCSFQGWSMEQEKERQEKGDAFCQEDGGYEGHKIAFMAKEIAGQGNGEGMTFGAPSSGYGKYEGDCAKETPFVTMYAVWDQYPQIQAADLYFLLEDAQNGILTEDYLLGLAKATDEELKSPSNEDGIMKSGADEENSTSFTIQDYQLSDFTAAEHEMNLTVTYRAQDAVGNVTVKMVRIYLADTLGEERDMGKVRFISAEYADTLAENSIWRTGEHAKKLASALSNKKTGEEYSEVTPMQKAFGIQPVLKPGSGSWDHVQEFWEFTHAQVLEVQAYAETAGVGGDPSEFLTKFGHCRVE